MKLIVGFIPKVYSGRLVVDARWNENDSVRVLGELNAVLSGLSGLCRFVRTRFVLAGGELQFKVIKEEAHNGRTV